MIIGIAGKAGSGKDLVGNIIQYLIACKKYEGMDCFNADYVNKGFDLKANYTNITEWKIKKFADRLKDIVCLLIGCTRQQLEDRNFKERELGEEWWMKTITYIDGGRRTIVNPTSSEELDLKSKYPISYNISITKLTPRILLQQIGTDLFRNQLHPNTWVNTLFADYKTFGETKHYSNSTPKDNDYPNWLITDVRFPNELEAIKNRNGITIRINRGLVERTGKLIQEPEHISETALNNAKFDYVIENDDTIEELLNKVKKILINEKII